MIQKWKTVKQIAEITGYKERTITNACQKGWIKAEKQDRRWLVDTQSALEFGKQKPHAPHTRNRQEKLEQAHDGGLDLKCESAPEKPEIVEKMALEDGFISKYVPELDTDDIDDPVAVALFEAAYAQIAVAFDLVSRAAAYIALKEKKKEYDA